MNFVRLVTHGLSAISVYSDIIGVLAARVATMVLTLAMAMAGIRGDGGRPALPTTDGDPRLGVDPRPGSCSIVLLQAIVFSILFSFLILGDRQATTFLPRRDYSPFVGDITSLDEGP